MLMYGITDAPLHIMMNALQPLTVTILTELWRLVLLTTGFIFIVHHISQQDLYLDFKEL